MPVPGSETKFYVLSLYNMYYLRGPDGFRFVKVKMDGSGIWEFTAEGNNFRITNTKTNLDIYVYDDTVSLSHINTAQENGVSREAYLWTLIEESSENMLNSLQNVLTLKKINKTTQKKTTQKRTTQKKKTTKKCKKQNN